MTNQPLPPAPSPARGGGALPPPNAGEGGRGGELLPSPLPHLQRQAPLAPHTSLKVGGPADYYLAVRTPGEAAAALAWAARHDIPCRWIGGGSNLLVAEAGFAGLAARYLADRLDLPTADAGELIVEAGHAFPSLARRLARAGWAGLEWASNVPGTVGGAVANNAGAFGSSVAETLAWAEILSPDGRITPLSAADLAYAYRTSRLKRRELGSVVVVRAAFRIRRAPPAETRGRIDEYQQRRTATQPRLRSAGSVFANPPGDYAGRLIEQAGIRGARQGRAQISDQHANFIVNLGGATAADVYALVRLAQSEVFRRFGLWLTPEIELFGRWTDAERSALATPQ